MVHKAAEAKGEFIGNNFTEKIVKSKPLPAGNSKDVEGTIIHQKRENKYWMNWNKYNKMLHCKIPELLNNSTVAKCWTRK